MTSSLHITVHAPDDGGWDRWVKELNEALVACEAVEIVNALSGANTDALKQFKHSFKDRAAGLKTAFDNRRGALSQKPIEDAA